MLSYLQRLRDTLNFKFKRLEKLLAYSLIQNHEIQLSKYSFLWDTGFSVYSQNEEDGILTFLIKYLKIDDPKILELGAGDFSECNSRFLVEFFNASAYLVDGNVDLRRNIDKSRLKTRTTIIAENIWLTRENVEEVCLRAKHLLSGLDIVSIDLDGIDYWLLLALPLDGISIVVVEFNSILSTTRPVTVPYNPLFDRKQAHFSHLYYGASLIAFQDLLETRGFSLLGVTRTGTNAFFVRNTESELLKGFNIDLERFQKNKSKESRNLEGKLSFLEGEARLRAINNCEVLDLESNQIVCLKILHGYNESD